MRERLHREVWTRFIRMPFGHLTDYADSHGEMFIPTAEECQKAMPNALGWWTPIENGAFFGGLYAIALLTEYRFNPTLKLEKEIHTLINGLFLLQDVGSRAGFIARGVADDGKSHYILSSEDQFVPWVMALYTYAESPVCRNKEEVLDRLCNALADVRNSKWRIPGDGKELYCNDWLNASDWRGMSKLLYCACLLAKLTGSPEDYRNYYKLRDGVPNGQCFTRLEIVSQGFSHDMVENTGLIQFWIFVAAHLALKKLEEWDNEASDKFNACRKLNGITALKMLKNLKEYDNAADGFQYDWRPINRYWQPFDGDIQKAVRNSCKMLEYWEKEIVPHRHSEHKVLGDALFGAIIAATSGDQKIISFARKIFDEEISEIDWESLHLCYAFAAESALIFFEHTV